MRLKETIEQAIFESCPEVEKEINAPFENHSNISLKIENSFRAKIGILSKYSAFVKVEELETDNKSSSLVIFKKRTLRKRVYFRNNKYRWGFTRARKIHL